MKQLLLSLLVVMSISGISHAQEDTDVISHMLIVEKNQEMERLLQKRDPKETIDFLHAHVKEDAVFNIELDNPTFTKETGQKSVKIDKTAYINSFIQGLHYVDDYKVKIDTKNIKISDNKKSAVVTETMTEDGVITHEKTRIPFNSQTTCTTTYSMNEGVITSDTASCKTSTGETNTI